jgi:predicted N-acetyltransferase YhbS
VIVRVERPEDRDASFEVERAAFDRDLEAGIARAVADEEGSFALVAEDDGTVIGHVQMSRAWIGATAVLSLGPIGVVPARQGEGLGGALVRGALDEASARGERVVMLLGAPGYYGRFGFVPGSTFGLQNPFAGDHGSDFVVDEADFQIVVLDEDPAELEGVVRWHPAFDEAG